MLNEVDILENQTALLKKASLLLEVKSEKIPKFV